MIEHLTIQNRGLKSAMLAIGAAFNAIPGQYYLATNTNEYFYGAQDGSLIGPLLTSATEYISSITDTATVDLGVSGGALTANVKLSAVAGQHLTAQADGIHAKALTIHAGSAGYLEIDGSYQLKVKQLLITDNTVDATNSTLTAHLTAVGYNAGNLIYQESDVIILTTSHQTWIQNGGTAGTTADFTSISADVTDSYIRNLFSGVSGVSYNPGTGVFSLATNGVLDTNLRQSVGTSVIGRSAGTTGNVADIVATANGQVLQMVGGVLAFGAIPGGGDHGGLIGLADDDHTQYALLAGRSTGQTLIGGSASLTLVGGTSTTADLNFKTTTGVGATGADMHFLVGNNGGTEAMTILNNGRIGMGISPDVNLSIYGASESVIKVSRAGVSSKASVWDFTTGQMKFGTITDDGFSFITNNATRLTMNGTSSSITVGTSGAATAQFYMYSTASTPTLGVVPTAPLIITDGPGTGPQVTLGSAASYIYLQARRGVDANNVYPLALNQLGGGVTINTATLSAGTILDAAGVINSSTGYRIANAATSGNYLRGNSTNFVSSALLASDLSGAVAVVNGGTGLSALGTALQQLRVNAGATAIEWFTPSATTYTFENGLTNSSGTVRFGGTLTQHTTLAIGDFNHFVTRGTGKVTYFSGTAGPSAFNIYNQDLEIISVAPWTALNGIILYDDSGNRRRLTLKGSRLLVSDPL